MKCTEAMDDVTSSGHKIKGLAPLSGLLGDENSPTESSGGHLSYINKLKMIKFGGTVGNLASPKEGLTYKMVRTLDCGSMLQIGKEWIKNPLNMALLLWVMCVAVSGAILFLVMTGMLNHVIQEKWKRDEWFEVNSQILNALFTLMCLYQHPKRFHHLVLLLRWKPEDVVRLRDIYCKNGTYKPHEWTHMMVVIFLLHLNCFAQYALCGLNLGYKRSERPAIGIGVCLTVAIISPAVAGAYCILSPLGKDYYITNNQQHERRKSAEKIFSFTLRNDQRVVEETPKWKGGLFDIWEDVRVAYLSIFCTFCVFGWNMERLGFGNRYVHIATFLLLCTAPFWIFNLAASNIENDAMRESLGITGILLCLFGLLYGGFWRTQMRKRFNLSQNEVRPGIGDCMQWLFCCWCSLAQEVRTADYYDIVEKKLIMKETYPARLTPLARESSTSTEFQAHSTSPGWMQEAHDRMKPPSLSTMRREDNDEDRNDNKV